jgi:hypothetical protein
MASGFGKDLLALNGFDEDVPMYSKGNTKLHDVGWSGHTEGSGSVAYTHAVATLFYSGCPSSLSSRPLRSSLVLLQTESAGQVSYVYMPLMK